MCSMANKILDGVRSILPCELAQVLQSERQQPVAEQRSLNEGRGVMLLDCRSFLAYNLKHISGALNVNVCTSLTRKRLQQGKVSLVDLVTSDRGKAILSSDTWAKAVVYDDSTTEIEKAPATHPVRLVLTSLVRQGKEVMLLKGGLKDFSKGYGRFVATDENSCPERTKPVREICPTTPIDAVATQILPFVYLGSARDAADAKFLSQRGITRILNLTYDCPNHFESDKNFIYKQVKIADNCKERIYDILEDAIKFIDLAKRQGATVLVHCQAGISRSSAVVIAYVMHLRQMSLCNAYAFVKDKRPWIAPNLSFMGQLMEFEDTHCRSSQQIGPLAADTSTVLVLT